MAYTSNVVQACSGRIGGWRLRKDEDRVYDTYLIAAPGFQCIARDKYSSDLTPSDTHSQIQVYVHIMDALAGSVDQYSGTVCRYGLRNFTSSEPFYDYCARMVGHTGPEIFWRTCRDFMKPHRRYRSKSCNRPTTMTTTYPEDATEDEINMYIQPHVRT